MDNVLFEARVKRQSCMHVTPRYDCWECNTFEVLRPFYATGRLLCRLKLVHSYNSRARKGENRFYLRVFDFEEIYALTEGGENEAKQQLANWQHDNPYTPRHRINDPLCFARDLPNQMGLSNLTS